MNPHVCERGISANSLEAYGLLELKVALLALKFFLPVLRHPDLFRQHSDGQIHKQLRRHEFKINARLLTWEAPQVG